MLPSCPPQSTPEAYHFFPFFLTAGNAQVIKVFPSSAIQFAVRSVGGAALNAALRPLVGMVRRPRAAELLQHRMALCMLLLHPPCLNLALCMLLLHPPCPNSTRLPPGVAPLGYGGWLVRSALNTKLAPLIHVHGVFFLLSFSAPGVRCLQGSDGSLQRPRCASGVFDSCKDAKVVAAFYQRPRCAPPSCKPAHACSYRFMPVHAWRGWAAWTRR